MRERRGAWAWRRVAKEWQWRQRQTGRVGGVLIGSGGDGGRGRGGSGGTRGKAGGVEGRVGGIRNEGGRNG